MLKVKEAGLQTPILEYEGEDIKRHAGPISSKHCVLEEKKKDEAEKSGHC